MASLGATAQPTQPTPGTLGTWCPPVTDPVAWQTVQCTVVPLPASPTPTTTTTTTTSVAPTTTTVVPTTTTTTPPQPSVLKGWELTRTNVGITPFGSCAALPLYDQAAKPARGTLIEGKRIEKALDLSNGDITIRKSCIAPRNQALRGALVTTVIDPDPGDCCVNGLPSGVGAPTIEDSDIHGLNLSTSAVTAACATDGAINLKRNHIYGVGSGICVLETGTEVSVLIQNNYVRNLRHTGQSHNSAATVRDFRDAPGRTLTFEGNRLEAVLGGYVTASLFIQPLWRQIHNVWVRDNWLYGETYNLVLEQRTGHGNMHATNNRFTPLGWGAATCDGSPCWIEWTDNHIYSATAVDAKGAVVPRP